MKKLYLFFILSFFLTTFVILNEGSVGLTSHTRNLFHKTLRKRGLAQLKEPGLYTNNSFYIPTRKLSGN